MKIEKDIPKTLRVSFILRHPIKVDNDRFLDRDWDEKREGSLTSAKMEQVKLKAYYDSFPSIDDTASGSELYVKEAEEFTKSILRNLPSGDATERSTACHVLANLLESQNMQCLFFDSTHGKNLHDASGHLAEIGLEDRPFVLKLNSSEGLGGRTRPKTQQGEIRYARALCCAIDQKQPHPVIEDIRDRLSKAHDINKKYIVLKTTYVGTFNVVYTVKKLTNRSGESFKTLVRNLKHQFEEYTCAKIHPLFNRPSFDISFFDERGNKTFPSQSEIHHIGPPGNTKPYIQPAGWTRFGLKVMGKYEDGDNWLDPFKNPKNWYRAFHGTKNAISTDFGYANKTLDKQYACVDALASIHEKGFRRARIMAHGSGVYCSPNPKYPEENYVGTVNVDTRQGKKRYKCMLQVAVNPCGVTFTEDNDIWLVPIPENIRSYGILIKEV